MFVSLGPTGAKALGYLELFLGTEGTAPGLAPCTFVRVNEQHESGAVFEVRSARGWDHFGVGALAQLRDLLVAEIETIHSADALARATSQSLHLEPGLRVYVVGAADRSAGANALVNLCYVIRDAVGRASSRTSDDRLVLLLALPNAQVSAERLDAVQGYAALKELDATAVDGQYVLPGGSAVRGDPFDIAWVVGRRNAAGVSARSPHEQARILGRALHVLVTSRAEDLLDLRTDPFDNHYKHAYAFGSLGVTTLLLPRERLHRLFSLRFMESFWQHQILGGRVDPLTVRGEVESLAEQHRLTWNQRLSLFAPDDSRRDPATAWATTDEPHAQQVRETTRRPLAALHSHATDEDLDHRQLIRAVDARMRRAQELVAEAADTFRLSVERERDRLAQRIDEQVTDWLESPGRSIPYAIAATATLGQALARDVDRIETERLERVAAVQDLQARLSQAGHACSSSGDFDVDTEQAVGAVQRERGLDAPPGIVDQDTWEALGGSPNDWVGLGRQTTTAGVEREVHAWGVRRRLLNAIAERQGLWQSWLWEHLLDDGILAIGLLVGVCLLPWLALSLVGPRLASPGTPATLEWWAGVLGLVVSTYVAMDAIAYALDERRNTAGVAMHALRRVAACLVAVAVLVGIAVLTISPHGLTRADTDIWVQASAGAMAVVAAATIGLAVLRRSRTPQGRWYRWWKELLAPLLRRLVVIAAILVALPWVALSGLLVPAYSNTIGGVVFEDTASTGLRLPNAPGLSGVKVYLVDQVGRAVAHAITGPDGSYTIDHLPAGRYTVAVLPRVDQNVVSPPRVADLWTGGRATADIALAPRNADTGFISGRVTLSGGTPGAMRVQAVDINGYPVASAPVNADGGFRLDNLPRGTLPSPALTPPYLRDDAPPRTVRYTVVLIAPPGYRAVSAPVLEEVEPRAPNDDGPGVSFALAAVDQPTASLLGSAYIDANGNHAREPGEAGVSGAVVKLQGADDKQVVAASITDSRGVFRFDGVQPGSYLLLEQLPWGVTGTASQSIALSAGQTIARDLDNQYDSSAELYREPAMAVLAGFTLRVGVLVILPMVIALGLLWGLFWLKLSHDLDGQIRLHLRDWLQTAHDALLERLRFAHQDAEANLFRPLLAQVQTTNQELAVLQAKLSQEVANLGRRRLIEQRHAFADLPPASLSLVPDAATAEALYGRLAPQDVHEQAIHAAMAQHLFEDWRACSPDALVTRTEAPARAALDDVRHQRLSQEFFEAATDPADEDRRRNRADLLRRYAAQWCTYQPTGAESPVNTTWLLLGPVSVELAEQRVSRIPGLHAEYTGDEERATLLSAFQRVPLAHLREVLIMEDVYTQASDEEVIRAHGERAEWRHLLNLSTDSRPPTEAPWTPERYWTLARHVFEVIKPHASGQGYAVNLDGREEFTDNFWVLRMQDPDLRVRVERTVRFLDARERQTNADALRDRVAKLVTDADGREAWEHAELGHYLSELDREGVL